MLHTLPEEGCGHQSLPDVNAASYGNDMFSSAIMALISWEQPNIFRSDLSPDL